VPDFTLRRFSRDDIPAGLRLCRAAGWNQLERDWRVFLDVHSAGCFAAVHDGAVIGSATTIRYETVAWISMLLVDPAWRGRGVGTALLERALDCLSDCECIKLDATPEGRRLYQQHGFRDEFRLWRMEGAGGGIVDPEVRPIAALHPALSHGWLLPNGDWVGTRPGHLATHIGPVIAESPENGARLVSHAMTAGERFFLDVPEPAEWAEALGFRPRRELVRMWRGVLQPTPPGTYAIIGPEFG
jgi:GNAT superfamily N-acetyltransferase